jgi:hypothetical protein
MKYLASYLLLQLGGNASPSASDISALLETVGVEAESEQLDKLIAELEGKDINEVSEALGYAQALDGWCGTCVAEKERSFGSAWESSGRFRGWVGSHEAIPDEGCEAWKRDTAEGRRVVCARPGPSLWMELLCHRCTRPRFIPLLSPKLLRPQENRRVILGRPNPPLIMPTYAFLGNGRHSSPHEGTLPHLLVSYRLSRSA